MRVLVAGAGAIGQWLAARLQEGGVHVTALTTPRHVGPLRSLRIEGETQWEGALPVLDKPGGGPYDAIVVTAKAHATAALAASCAPLLAPDGVFATMQNGFLNAQKLARHADPRQVAVAVTSHGVTLLAPGRLRHAGLGFTRVGPFAEGGEAAARRLEGLLAAARLEPQWSDAIDGHVWLKGLVNHAVNPVAAVAGVENGALLEGPLRAKAKALAHEGWSLSRAAGVALPGVATEADLWDVVRTTLERTRANRCSMLQDVDQRRPTEVEQISGFLVRTARRLGYPFFASEEAYRAVKALEAGYLGEEQSLGLTRSEVAALESPAP